jgi:hypothetical protein
MTVDANTLADFAGKQVILHRIKEDGSIEELEGKVEDASEVGMAFKPKGKRDVDLVLPDEIEEISLAPTKPKTLSQKKLKPIAENAARQHLLDRHGYDRSVVNEMSDEQAFAEHNDIDHDDLGHRHEAEDEGDDDEAGESSED